MINKSKLQKLNNKELQEIVYKKIDKIDKLIYRLNVYRCYGSLSNLIDLNNKGYEKLLERIDYFIDEIRENIIKNDEILRDEIYNTSNNEMINNHLNKNQLIDFIEYLDDYIYQIIEDFREYQEYKNNGFLYY